ncbi:uncharacterized protein LOC141673425 [Apium graveolens]|uniref:uncharacterized protein LOC141673425 n=1 Tax=Apium graveolens TaxID=4045 RepID=UPI003D7B8BAE
MICNTYPNFAHEGHSTQYLSERAILTPTNQTVGHLNSLIVDKLPGESMFYFSVDAAEEFGGTDEDLNEAFPIEYLNSLNVAGMPPHDLKLKVGVVVMLMRNLNQTLAFHSMYGAFSLRFKDAIQIGTETNTFTDMLCHDNQQISRSIPEDSWDILTSPNGLTIFVDDESGAATNITQNVVYKEVFYGLPEA